MSRMERRQSSRCAVDFFVQEERDDRTYLHPAVNLSTSGMYLLVSDDLRAIDSHHTMALEFTLPTGAPIKARARIAYADERHGIRGVGIAFETLSDEDRAAIARYCEVANGAQRRIQRSA